MYFTYILNYTNMTKIKTQIDLKGIIRNSSIIKHKLAKFILGI